MLITKKKSKPKNSPPHFMLPRENQLYSEFWYLYFQTVGYFCISCLTLLTDFELENKDLPISAAVSSPLTSTHI